MEKTPITTDGYLQLVDSLNSYSKKMSYTKGIIKSILLKGKYLTSIKEEEQALEICKEAVKFCEQANDLYELGNAYYDLGGAYFDLKKRDEAIAAIKKSAVYRSEVKDSSGLGYSFNFTGYIYWIISDYDSAVFYFEKALEIRNKLPNKINRATTYNNLGTIFYNWSLHDKALDYYLRSLELQKEQHNNSGIAKCLCNIGLVYQETAQDDKAIEYYRESLPYALASKLPQTIGYAYNCLGSVYSRRNNDSSLFYLKKSLETYQAANDTVGLILALQELGSYYLDLKDLSPAKDYFKQMLDFAQQENIPMRIARAYKSLGEVYLLENNFLTAQKYFEASVEIGKKSALNFILQDALGYLSQIYEREGKIVKALEALRQRNYYKDLIENEGTQKRLIDLKNKAEYEKYRRSLDRQMYENYKQKIYMVVMLPAILVLLIAAAILFRTNNKKGKLNLLLKEKNSLIEGQSREIQLKNVELLELNEAKEKLFSIIAHDLRSPFNVLINFGTLLKEEYYNLSDEERVEYISNLEETAIKTFELVENLLNLSASRSGRISYDPAEVYLSKTVEKVINLSSQQANKKNIKLVNLVSAETKAFADKSMLEIVIRNLVNNAIKYSASGGEIKLSAEDEKGKLLIMVEDNGIGMDDATISNIFNINVVRSKNGSNGEKGTGLGLGLCKEFVEKHGGEIWAESQLEIPEEGKKGGSKFIFSLPVKKTNEKIE
ncbi:MAG: tetratricopeptide repeat-containing sensor histidine kinase [Ignavibacteriaceae bacterium]|nr:tetratricopeptide repeat-containing sensor histidine kinase [Ignavibacteriaceae bacterium]